jgi:hypothetical protein
MDIKVLAVSTSTALTPPLIATLPLLQRTLTPSRQWLKNGEDRPGKKEGAIVPRNSRPRLQRVIANPFGVIRQQPQEQEQLQPYHHQHHPLNTTTVGAVVNNITADNDNMPQVAGTKTTRSGRMMLRGSVRKRKEPSGQGAEVETGEALTEPEKKMTARDLRIREIRTGKEAEPRMTSIHPPMAPPDNNSQTRVIMARINPTRDGTTETSKLNQRTSNTHLKTQQQYPQPAQCPSQIPIAFCRLQDGWAI